MSKKYNKMILVGIISFHISCSAFMHFFSQESDLNCKYHRMYSDRLNIYQLCPLDSGILFLQFPVVRDTTYDRVKNMISNNLANLDLLLCIHNGEESLSMPYELEFCRRVYELCRDRMIPLTILARNMSDHYYDYCLNISKSYTNDSLIPLHKIRCNQDLEDILESLIDKHCFAMANSNYARCVNSLTSIKDPHELLILLQAALVCIDMARNEGIVIQIGDLWNITSDSLVRICDNLDETKANYFIGIYNYWYDNKISQKI